VDRRRRLPMRLGALLHRLSRRSAEVGYRFLAAIEPSASECERGLGPLGLYEPAFGHRDRCPAGYDDVVQRADVDELECLLQAPGQRLVRFTRLGMPARVVVSED